MKYRILHVIDTGGPGGAETVLKYIVDNLPEDEFISEIIVPSNDWLFSELSTLGFGVSIVPRNQSPDLRFLWALIKKIRSFKPDIIHCHLLTSSVYASVAAKFFHQLPVITTFHGLPDIRGNSKTLRIKGIVLSRSRNRLVFVANHIRKEISSVMGLNDSISHTIHNGIVFEATKNNTVKTSGINVNKDIIIGSVGNIRPAKDYPTLLETAAIVCKSCSNVKFVIAGQGTNSSLNSLKIFRDKIGIKDKVEFRGFVSDIREFISTLDIFFSCSITEGLPLAVLEAAGSACPIIASECGGNQEILRGNSTKYLVPIQNPEAAAQKIIAMINDLESVKQDAFDLSIYVRNRFNISMMVNQYIDLYKEALEND